MASNSLTSVLVVGGCGFLGYEVVCLLTREPGCAVSVLSRNPKEPRLDGVSYYSCDTTDLASLRALLVKIQPQTVMNTASPRFYQDNVDNSLLHKVNVNGTQNLVEVATAIKSTQAFIHTSSTSVHVPSTVRFLKENAPLVDRSTASSEYQFTKAIADTMVLEANCPNLRTLCLRCPAIYGERDTQGLPGSMAILRDKKTHIQLGDNKNFYDAVYVRNAASAHVMAAKALLADGASTKVDGKPFSSQMMQRCHFGTFSVKSGLQRATQHHSHRSELFRHGLVWRWRPWWSTCSGSSLLLKNCHRNPSGETLEHTPSQSEPFL